RVEHVAERVAHERLVAGSSRERLVERELEAGKSVVVDTRVAEDLRRDRVLRVEATLLGIETQTGDVPRLELRGSRRVGLALDVDEAVRPVGRSEERRVGREGRCREGGGP